MKSSVPLQGGVTAPSGYLASGVCAGIKKQATADLAVLFSKPCASLAAMLTTNKVQAAPVRLCRERLQGGRARAVVVNSGNANACTGASGRRDAERMAAFAAERLGVPEAEVFVCSTGTIGVPLPMDKIETGIQQAVDELSETGGDRAARAIMTTDTVPKAAAVEMQVGGVPVRLGGMAKGVGMIEPNMATMLAFLTTDASVSSPDLQVCLKAAVDESFHRITVDGDQSTNDTVMLMANGAAGSPVLRPDSPDWPVFCEAVQDVARSLAIQMVEDAEGATKFVTVNVSGALSREDAGLVARAVANSLLVKTSWFGCDPNWGRVMDAVGYSGAEVREELVDIAYDEVAAVRQGQSAGEPLQRLEKVLARDRFSLNIDLHLGDAGDTVYTCDCSHDYVRINSEYTT